MALWFDFDFHVRNASSPECVEDPSTCASKPVLLLIFWTEGEASGMSISTQSDWVMLPKEIGVTEYC